MRSHLKALKERFSDLLADCEIKEFSGTDYAYWCKECSEASNIEKGHKVVSSAFAEHFRRTRNAVDDPSDLFLDGPTLAYRRALRDYPIKRYLQHIRVPVVLFLNSERIEQNWQEYQHQATRFISDAMRIAMNDTARDTAPFLKVDEVFPPHFLA